MFAYTTDNTLSTHRILQCELLDVDSSGWARVRYGSSERWVPANAWASSRAAACTQLRDRLLVRLERLRVDAVRLQQAIQAIDSLPLDTIPSAGLQL